MNLVCGIKKFSTPKGRKGWITTDNRRWKVALLANEWQKRLNKNAAKKAVKVLAGEGHIKVRSNDRAYVKGKYIKKSNRREYIGTTATQRRAYTAFCIRYNLASGMLISVNRLFYMVATDPTILNELVATSKIK